jgi:hypothetical protein
MKLEEQMTRLKVLMDTEYSNLADSSSSVVLKQFIIVTPD